MAQSKAKAPAAKALPPYNVILLNDPNVEYLKVVQVLIDVMRWDEEKAGLHASEAHTEGRSLLCTTHKERAELYVEQFSTFNVKVTVESAQ